MAEQTRITLGIVVALETEAVLEQGHMRFSLVRCSVLCGLGDAKALQVSGGSLQALRV